MRGVLAALPQHIAERLCLSDRQSISPMRLRLRFGKMEAQPDQFHSDAYGKAKPHRNVLRQSRVRWLGFLSLVLALALCAACTRGERRSGVPPDAQSVLDTAIEDINTGRYDKLYNEAADEWRRDATLEESKATFERLREKLGRATVRDLQTAREEQTSTAPLAGHSLIAIYQTSFEHGHAMETFTLVERDGKWFFAKYFVSSTALK